MKTNRIAVALLVVLLGLTQAANADAAAKKETGGQSLGEKATDPTAILTQLQLQNLFIPSTYDADGYANTFIIQPVLPMKTGWSAFPMQVIRPTFPISVLTADPDGPLNDISGNGDLVLFDMFLPKRQKWGTWGWGPVAVFPTASNDRLGQGKYQLGPAFVLLYTAVPKWQLGFLIQNPISIAGDSDRDAVSTLNVQPIANRHFEGGWYAGIGDLPSTYEWLGGNYNIPINFKLGKITKIDKQPVNMFIQPFWTPKGMRKGPASEWGVKFNLTLLFP